MSTLYSVSGILYILYDYQFMSTLYSVSGSHWAPVSLKARRASVGNFCKAYIAHLPTSKFALGPLDTRPERSRTNCKKEGEREKAADNNRLGKFSMRVPPAPAKVPKIEI